MILKSNKVNSLKYIDEENGEEQIVYAKSLFPLSNPLKHIVLENDKGDEVYLLNDISGLESSLLKLLENVIRFSTYRIEINKIKNVLEKNEIRQWHVEVRNIEDNSHIITERKFITRIDEWPQKISNTKYIIKDVYEDLYMIPDINKLDKNSLEILWTFCDI